MKTIAFVDIEVDPRIKQVLDIGGFRSDGISFHKNDIADFENFIKGSHYVCGHNILNHDLKYIETAITKAGVEAENIIDTLYLSPLLFPTKPYHSLLKDDKLQSDEMNNPLNDSIKAKDLFYDEATAFNETEEVMKQLLYLLLKDKKEFAAFFKYLEYKYQDEDVKKIIMRKYDGQICSNININHLIDEYEIELAYSLSLIQSFIESKQTHSITPPWVLKNYPDVERIMYLLRNSPCVEGCKYCDNQLDIVKGLKKHFGFNSYRTFGGEPLQEKAVQAAMNNKSIIAVFPTGGGKSLTFQVPALMSAQASKGLTIVISPLQSLMKDQVDNLEKLGITEAVTINGMLDPIERAKSFERIEDGSASILYIAPESLRSKSIERLILSRKVARFVIDEAHCFSSWGQDFRVDYLYIADFIKLIQEKKNLNYAIPVSCFTATAKQKVIEDIRDYFEDKLDLELELFTSKVSRTNLHYMVYQKEHEEDKYQSARDLIEQKECPTIIYVSRTRKAYQLAERLSKDGFSARPYHGKMDIKEKSDNQNAFINGEVSIMVATSAFGMGVDKKDVGMVIHYEISDSLENYIQEAGRAGRDENITADCYVLFNEEDLSKHFILLNQTKLSIKEIQQIWRAIKEITRYRSSVSNSALEIARKAGWDDSVVEIESRVTAAIAALEDAGYLKRGQNMPRVFASSIVSKTAQDAIDKIHASEKFSEKQKQKGIRIIKKLFSTKSRKQFSNETPESRVDYISDHLGIVREEVINIINLLREENILADAKDLSAFIKKGDNKNKSLRIVEKYSKIENYLVGLIEEQEKTFHIKELNEEAEDIGCVGVNTSNIKTILNFWAIKNWIKCKYHSFSKNHLAVLGLHPQDVLRNRLERRHELAIFIINLLYEKSMVMDSSEISDSEEVLVEFSVHELKKAYENSISSFGNKVSIDEIEDTLFYLSRIEALNIEGGFLVVYNRLTIERLEKDNKIRYKVEDYKKLNQFYENKVQQIHIVGEYAKRMIINYKDALQFVDDYFQLNYSSFLQKYFKGSRQNDISRNLTPTKFKQLFGELSPTQLSIIKDDKSKHIAVAAGPGSGKTRVLVHKLASLLLMEDVKYEQLLMLTFSRAAATEFKKRLLKLIGNAAYFIEIKTFHSYCFDILGRVGNLDKSETIIKRAIQKINDKEIELSRITKTVLVIDEAQDLDRDEYNLIQTLMNHNEEMRVIAVGDDDQNIYEFRGASSKYLEHFINKNKASKNELVENYRSKSNIVFFANQFVKRIKHRLKHTPIIPVQTEDGNIRVVRYHSQNITTPLVEDIMQTDLAGTTCVLTKTNEEALQITGLLLRNGIQAKLIQSNDGFSLYNMVEVRYFLEQLNLTDDIYTISEERWENAKRRLLNKYSKSNKLDICINIIKDFETINKKTKYKTDLEVFIGESRLEDFYNSNGETIFVSTIHKAKGKEFDNIFLMLENFIPKDDADNRLIYVAMTRAKNNLFVHLNSDLLDNIHVANLTYLENRHSYYTPTQLAMHLTHKDIWLDYFINRQFIFSSIVSGDSFVVQNNECYNAKGQIVFKFSNRFLKEIEAMNKRGYQLKSAKANFIVHWQKEGTNKEIKIILPEVLFDFI